MGYRFRVFVRTASGEIRRLPLAKYERLLDRDPATSMPEFTSKEMRAALVVLRVEGGRVMETTLADTLKIQMNHRGQVSKRWHDRFERLSRDAVGAYASEMLGGPTPERTKVVSLPSSFLKKRLEREFHWKPSGGEVTEMFRLAHLR